MDSQFKIMHTYSNLVLNLERPKPLLAAMFRSVEMSEKEKKSVFIVNPQHVQQVNDYGWITLTQSVQTAEALSNAARMCIQNTVLSPI